MIVKGTAGQTAFDLAIQHYGDISGIDFIIEDNPTLRLEELVNDKDVFIRDEVINGRNVKHLANHKITTY